MSNGEPPYSHPGHHQPAHSPAWPRPQARRRWIPWVFGAGGFVVIALAVVIILVVTSGGGNTPTATPPKGNSNAGTGVVANAAPEPCDPSQPAVLCFPQTLTADSVVTKMQSLGAQCDTTDKLFPNCRLGEPMGDRLGVLTTPFPSANPKIMSLAFQYYSPEGTESPAGKEKAVKGLLDGVNQVLAAFIPNAAEFPQRVTDWLRANMGSCPAPAPNASTGPTAGGYLVGCSNPGATNTSAEGAVLWTVTASLRAPGPLG